MAIIRNYGFTALTGEGAGSLDRLPFTGGPTLTDGDMAYGVVSDKFHVYKYSSASTATEASPYIISTSDAVGRWELIHMDYEVDALLCFGESTNYTQTTIEAALTAIGTTNNATLLLRPGNWAITANLTIPSNVTLKLPAGSLLQVATGKTLTINGPFEAGLYQVFDCSGTGSVANLSIVNIRWFGAVGAIMSDDSIPIQKSCDALTTYGKLIIPAGNFYCNDIILSTSDVNIQCIGNLRSFSVLGTNVITIGTRAAGIKQITGNINVIHEHPEDWFTYVNLTSIQLINIQESILYFDIVGANVAIDLLSDGHSTCYNKFYINRIIDCKKSICTHSINHGWTNENTWINGRLTQNSGKINYTDVMYYDIGDNDFFANDSNRFIAQSIEGYGKFGIIRGIGNYFELIRLEVESTTMALAKFIEFKTGVVDPIANHISFIYDNFTPNKPLWNTGTWTRLTEGKFVIPDANGDMSGYFYPGKLIGLVLDDTSEVNALCLIAGVYTPGVGTTVYISLDVLAPRTVVKVYCNSIWIDAGSESNIIDFLYENFIHAGLKLKNTGLFYTGNASIPVLTISDGNSLDDILLSSKYLGVEKLKIEVGGNIDSKGTLTFLPFKATTAQLTDATHAINTTNKYQGKPVFNTDTKMYVYAISDVTNSHWYNAVGADTHTPI